MAIHITRWSPDTCDCILEYSWDDATSEAERVHTPTSTVQRCTAHQPLPNVNSVFNAVLDENPRKNLGLDEILQNAPNTNWFDVDPQSGTRIFKNNIRPVWTFSGTAPNRVLTLTFQGITLTTA